MAPLGIGYCWKNARTAALGPWVGTVSIGQARGIEGGNLCRRQGAGRGLCAGGVGWVDAILVGDVPLAIGGAGHYAGLLRVFRGSLAFIVEEKEKLVFLDGTAQRCAKRISDEAFPAHSVRPQSTRQHSLNQSFAHPKLVRLYS